MEVEEEARSVSQKIRTGSGQARVELKPALWERRAEGLYGVETKRGERRGGGGGRRRNTVRLGLASRLRQLGGRAL